ncbi:hypothetical protein PsorP6_008426 [Peronosclerospora sorghi]|uniref:Uncharacterized protein n=1 Tax=Peronosclerospora sorghi TaxID=230839 RepID=A0ACC0WCT6_9STRA|nr:hypothetical protein PsorP6_008426 [Peronosclerospora sorghi]
MQRKQRPHIVLLFFTSSRDNPAIFVAVFNSGRIDDIKGIALAAKGISEALNLILELCRDISVKLQTQQLRGGLAFVEEVAKSMGNIVARGAYVLIGREKRIVHGQSCVPNGDALGSAERLGRKARKSRAMSIGGIG